MLDKKRHSGRVPDGAKAAVGLRAHSGWAVLVAVGGSAEAPELIRRWRIIMSDPAIPGSKQPFHAAEPMKLPDAEAYMRRCTASTNTLTCAAVQSALAELRDSGCHVAGCCVLLGSGRPTGDLAATLASHPLIHTAEGEFFRAALKSACESCGVPVCGIREKELLDRAAAALGLSPDELKRQTAEMGKTAGPPWREDEKLCAVAGRLLLCGTTAHE